MNLKFQKQTKIAADFLANEMGQMVNRASRDKIPINLNKEEIQTYIKRFQIIDKDRKGFVSINDIRRSLKVMPTTRLPSACIIEYILIKNIVSFNYLNISTIDI